MSDKAPMQTGETPEAVPSLAATGAHAVEPDDRRASRAIELAISRLLRWGVIVSVAVVLIGMGLTFAHHPSYFTDRSAETLKGLTRHSEDYPHSFHELASGLRDLQGRSVVLLGLVLLVATPILRVIVSIAAFWAEKDRRYVVITLIVLGLLGIAFWLGAME